MTTDLKPCPFCGEKVEMHDYTHAHVAAWVMIHRCQVVGVIHLENYSGTRLAEVWNTRAPTVSDTGADSGPGPSTSQAGEAPRSDAPALDWRPIATAPRDETLFLATGLDGGSGPDRHVAIVFCDGAGFFDDFDEYTYLTHWMPLPAPPVDSSAAPSTPVDNKISADPVGKEG